MVIGLDVDGVIRKLPFPFNLIMKYSSPTDILERARLHIIKKIIIHFIIFYCPFILNGDFIAKFQGKNVIIISGRREKIKEIIPILKRYLHIKKIYFRGNRPLYEEEWKLKICKKEKIDLFYEDRKFVLLYLRRNGINALEPTKLFYPTDK